MKHRKTYFGFEKNVFFTGVVSFFMDVSSEMIYPLVPLFLASVLGVNKSIIGLIEGIAESTSSILKVFSGWLSDRIGNRKNLMIAGYAVSTLSRPIIATAGGWHRILASRFIDRLGKGVRTAPRDAIIAEASPPDRLARAFGLHRAMDTMGAVVGPGIAFLLLWAFSNNYRSVFWLSMVPGIIAVLVIIFCISEKKQKTNGRLQQAPRITLHALDAKTKYFIAIAALFALGNSSDAFLVLKAQRTGIPVTVIPIVYLFFNLMYAASAIPAGMTADRFGKKRTILSGFILFAVLYYAFGAAATPGSMWVLFGLYGVFMGLTEGVQKAYFATIMPGEMKATAFGAYATAVGLAALPASLIGGWLWDHVAPAATFYFGSATAALSAMLFIMFIRYFNKEQR